MAITRRGVGFGLLGLSALFTTGVVTTRSHPEWLRAIGLGGPAPLRGYIGGEKQGLLADPGLLALLRPEHIARLEGVVAGGVEQCRDPALIATHPAFLWPAAEGLAALAQRSGLAVRRQAVVLQSPLVLHTWESIAAGLTAAGYAQAEGGVTYVDIARLIQAVAAGRSWGELGVSSPGGVRLQSTDPNRAASGMLFAGMTANALTGGVATRQSLPRATAGLNALFGRMGPQPATSSELFDDFIAGGIDRMPLIVGYESQLLGWIVEDAARWRGLGGQGGAARPVTLYPRPTMMATHTLISLAPAADHLLDVLATPAAQIIAWRDHGFRSALGAAGGVTRAVVAGRLPVSLPPVQAVPDAETLTAILAQLPAGSGPGSH